MSEDLPITDTELTNMVRGFDAPAKSDHLELLKQQARDREQEMEHTKEEQSSLHEFFRDIEKGDNELER